MVKKYSLTFLIRRGGAPPGAAAFIKIGGMGVSTPIIDSEQFNFQGKLFTGFFESSNLARGEMREERETRSSTHGWHRGVIISF